MTTIFNLTWAGKELTVKPVKKGNAYLFLVDFPDGTHRLILTRATGEDTPRFWTSIPEGRLKEAGWIGSLIVAHYKSLQEAEKQQATSQ